jgi:hypothetical protein
MQGIQLSKTDRGYQQTHKFQTSSASGAYKNTDHLLRGSTDERAVRQLNEYLFGFRTDHVIDI